MNKADFISKVAELTGDTKVATKANVEAVFDAMIDVLVSGDTVEYPGFGKFKVKERDAHTARNPKSGETVEVEAKKSVRFTPSSLLKSAINE